MDSPNIKYYKEQLIEYLKSTKTYRCADDTKIQQMVDAIECDLFNVIRKKMDDTLQVIYDFLNKDSLNELINETNSGRSLSSLNEQSGGLLRSAMNFYVGYLSSKKHPLAEKEKKGGKKKNLKKQAPIETENTFEAKTKSVISEPALYEKLEGQKYEASVTRYERNQGKRNECIAHYGYVCQVCEINFEQIYGEIGRNFIEVHHLHPVSQGERQINPIEDLIPLCSNCHSMIHRQEDVSDWRGLKEKFLRNKTKEKKHA